MRIIFAGTPDFSVAALQAIIAAGHEVVAVFCQPDRQSGRGRKTRAGPVKQCAIEHGLAIEQPVTLKDSVETVKCLAADAMVVVAYGLLLPDSILHLPKYGCLNIHASLLPRWRGAAPIHRAIEAGDKESGITIMQMDKGLDTGGILSQYPLKIAAPETSQTLHDKLAKLGATSIVDALSNIQRYRENTQAQQNDLSSYAKKITKQESEIDWTEKNSTIERRIRAFSPWPGTQTSYKQQALKILAAKCIDEVPPAVPGTILQANKEGIHIACGNGTLSLLKLQRSGGKALTVEAFINGMPLETNLVLGSSVVDNN